MGLWCGPIDIVHHSLLIHSPLFPQTSDLTAILITSSAEVPGLIFSLITVYFLSRKVAFAVPLALITVVLIPAMAGQWTHVRRVSMWFKP